MNLLALAYFFSLICIVIIGVTVFNRNPKEPANRAFSLFCFSQAIFALGEFGLTISRTSEEAQIWASLHAEWPLLIAVGTHFVLLYTGNRRLMKPLWARGLIYGPALVFCVLELTVDLLYTTPVRQNFGWILGKPVVGPVSIVALVWLFSMLPYLVFIINRYITTLGDTQRKKQTRELSFGLSIMAVMTSFDAMIAFSFTKYIPGMTPFGMAIADIFVGHSMWKHRLFSLTPMTAADSIISTMTDMLFLMDQEGRILTANRAAYSTLSYKNSRLVGKSAVSLFSSEVGWLRHVLRAEHASSQSVTDIEVSFLTADGQPIPASLSGTVIRDTNHGIQGILLIGRDITVRKKTERERAELEAKYQQAQKLESIGRLAGGVAHDINNILGAIMISTAVLKDEIDSDSDSAQCIENVLAGCRRGRDLTQNLLGFARKGQYNKTRITLNEIVVETTAVLRRTIPKSIGIKNQLDSQHSIIVGDRSQIQNVIMNIAINASDSIKKVGELEIRTRDTYLDESACSDLGNLIPGDYIQIKVIDNGGGMDSVTKANAFEPFFTTKARGKGTGLGLSMAYGVVVNHGGTITIDSEIDKGTVVTIYLPTLDAKTQSIVSQAAGEVAINRVEKKHKTNSAVILLVDDEPLFQSSTRRLLEKLGHTVYVAENGSVAVELYKMYRDTISLVLLDMLMPVMDGSETFIKLKEVDPNIKILIISGFDKDENVKKLLTRGACGYIQKPFDMETLYNKLTLALQ